jgi:hydroxymethylglutaryl-CoA lyase
VKTAQAGGRAGQITISAAFGCPFEDEVAPARVIAMAKRAADSRPIEIALADTIGVAVPAQVDALVGAVREAIAPIPVRAHFHNTRNTAIANVWAAVEAGASVVDASIGGLGGCPFAPRATGNVPSEDVAYLLARSGIETGLDIEKLIVCASWLSSVLGRPLPGMVSRAGNFPKSARSAGEGTTQ